jgi:two-component system, response regulator PdtaR
MDDHGIVFDMISPAATLGLFWEIPAMGKIRILIVEDESLLALNIQRLLNRLGYDAFRITACGEDAVEIARREHPDLIMMDIQLRGRLDGLQTMERIRTFLDSPVIYTTAFSDDETLERTKHLEPSVLLQKPYEITELRSVIETCALRRGMKPADGDRHSPAFPELKLPAASLQ